MKITVAILASIAGAFITFASAQDPTSKTIGVYDDRPFICGALFTVLVEAHSEDRDREVYNHYKSRFDRSFDKAKSNIRSAGGGDHDAALKMQENIEFLAKLLDQKKPETGDLLSSCERS
ncbi:hypothetical protein [Pararhizobium sp. PWRC1-1]|uniref:hypothetical protein n=1 Tax=Pararhizobium sp. PWRC1-1 TaxID=2804566 RepID=UPI003CFBB318